MTAGFVEFEFDLPDALLQSLISIFDNLESAPLVRENVANIPDAQGVYQLRVDGQVVYIGKTDGEAGLRRRLARHAFTIQHRQNLTTADVTFKAIRVYVFTAIDLETQLIRHYRTIGTVAWNDSGFGSNDPGRRRDETDLKPEGFDALYPIDLDQIVNIPVQIGAPAAQILLALKSALPYTLRFETLGRGSRKAHPELESAIIRAPLQPPLTTRGLLLAVLAALPEGWQATLLAGRIILYRENKHYAFGIVVGRSGSVP